MKTVRIAFGAAGYVTEDIEVADDVDEQVLADKLASGEWVTTIQEGGSLEVTASGQVIGRVVNIDNELEYDEFELVSV